MTPEIEFATLPMWIGFLVFVGFMLALDIFVFGANKAHKVSVKEAASWSAAWFALALAFCAGLWWHLSNTLTQELANQKALEFLTGYLIEKSLSVDNIFVFLLIFSVFHVPVIYQRRVLIYGVMGAIFLRIIMISAGAWLVSEFSWVLYIFGALLIATGIKMLIAEEKEPDLQNNFIIRFAKKHLKITENYHGEKFSIIQDGKRWFTPLFLVLILIEISDLIFAVDSIPAIFAITTDPFIVATSNIFAILGLRALYFLLADMADRFHLLKYGLAMVLVFIGGKMLLTFWFHMPIYISLLVIVLLIGGSVAASLWSTREHQSH